MTHAHGYILALDQGTTSSRALVFNHDAQVCAVGQNSFAQYYPKPGWVEHDALEILTSQLNAITEALVVGGIKTAEIKGIGITNQRETTVIWNRETGIPIAPAIVWQCRRTASMIEELTSAPTVKERIRNTTGLIPDAYFSASKVKWLLDNTPGARELARQGALAFGTIDSWLVWQLTGGTIHATDRTNASRTMLFDIHANCWDEWLLDLFEVPAGILPEVKPSASDYGVTQHRSLPRGIPLCGIAGDQQAALFGQGCLGPGEAKNTYGTGSFMLTHTGTEAILSEHHLITTLAASAPLTAQELRSTGLAGAPPDVSTGVLTGVSTGMPTDVPGPQSFPAPPMGAEPPLEYALEGSVYVSGALIQWLRDELGLIRTSAETEILARQVADTAGVHIVPAFTGLGAPYWDMEARGAILGLTRGTTKVHIVRAALEAMAFQLSDLVEAVSADTAHPLECLKVDGGASANDFLLQFQSDLLGCEVYRPVITESTALGAAFLAGLQCGFWQNTAELLALRNKQRGASFSPHMEERLRAEHLRGWKDAVSRVLSS